MADTKTISVWHLDNTWDAGWAETPAAWPVGYTKVADVEGEDLDDVFRITNPIDSAWWRELKHDVPSSGIRSSSVGDVFEIDGVGHRIATAGFEAVSGHPGIEKGRALDAETGKVTWEIVSTTALNGWQSTCSDRVVAVDEREAKSAFLKRFPDFAGTIKIHTITRWRPSNGPAPRRAEYALTRRSR